VPSATFDHLPDISLVTVIAVPASGIVEEEFIIEAIESNASDDVFRREFLAGVLLAGPKDGQITAGAIARLQANGNIWFEFTSALDITAFGPHILVSGHLKTGLPFV
jgi:hypothetical protein